MAPKYRKDHDQMCFHVCVGCLKSGCQKKVTDNNIKIIREYVLASFSLEDRSVPQGLCSSCYFGITKSKTLSCNLNYEDLRRNFQALHGKENFCECYICKAGRRMPIKKAKTKTPMKLPTTCQKCLSQLFPGKPHDCKLGNRVENVLKWLPEDVSQQVNVFILICRIESCKY